LAVDPGRFGIFPSLIRFFPKSGWKIHDGAIRSWVEAVGGEWYDLSDRSCNLACQYSVGLGRLIVVGKMGDRTRWERV